MQAQLRPAPLLGQRQHALRSSQGPGHCPGQPRRLRLAAPRAQQLQEPPPAPSKARLNDRRSVTGQPARCTHGRNSAPAPPAAAALASSATLASLASHPPLQPPASSNGANGTQPAKLPELPFTEVDIATLRASAPPPPPRPAAAKKSGTTGKKGSSRPLTELDMMVIRGRDVDAPKITWPQKNSFIEVAW